MPSCPRLGILFLYLLPAIAAGDGKFFAEPKEAEPWIPRQAMIAAFHDGMETLIVESELSAETGQRFAWIVPLPAEPTEVREGTPGQLKTVLSCLGPEIHEPIGLIFPLAFLLLVSILLAYRIRTKHGTTLFELLTLVFIGAVLFAITTPNFLGIEDTPQLPELASRQNVGNYDVSVLRPKTVEEISNWFKVEGFAPLASESHHIFDEYIAEGWVFAVAQLLRDSASNLTPHPLQFTFPAAAPIFPMRLTADREHVTNLSLVVIAEKPYELPGFETVYRDVFQKKSTPFQGWNPDDPKEIPLLISSAFMRSIGDPRIVDLASKESWITYLRAKLDANAMAADLYPVVTQEANPNLLHLYTHSKAIEVASILGIIVFIIALPLAGLLKHRKHFFIAIPCILFISVASGAAKYWSLPQTEVVYSIGSRGGAQVAQSRLHHYLSEVGSTDPGKIEQAARKAMENSRFSEGVGPRTYRIEREGDTMFVSATDYIGRPYRLNLNALAEASRTTETLQRR